MVAILYCFVNNEVRPAEGRGALVGCYQWLSCGCAVGFFSPFS